VTAGDSVFIRDQNLLGEIQGRNQHPRSFLIETEKGTIRRNRSALVKAELLSPSKADKQATSTGTANYHAFQETEEKMSRGIPFLVPAVSYQLSHVMVPNSTMCVKRSIPTLLYSCCGFSHGKRKLDRLPFPVVRGFCTLTVSFSFIEN